jgi:hypothetical protein
MAPQEYDYANPDQSGPNAGYMRFDPDPVVRQQQDDEIQKNLTAGARGLGEIVVGGVTDNAALARKGAMRYAEATGVVDPRTVQVILGAYTWLASGAGMKPANAAPRTGGGPKTASTVDDILAGAKPGRATKGRSTQFERPGGFDQAAADFDALGLENVQGLEGGGRMGTLPDGRRVIVRPNSSQGSPTLEIQAGKNKIKVRYGDE